MSDGDIIARVRAGDTAAFAELVRRHQDRVYGMARRTTGKPEDADDLAQDVFLSVFRGLAGFKGDAQFTTWLYRIAWNRCADWLRVRQRRGRRTVPLEEADDVPDERADPSATTVARDDQRRLHEAVDGLDERYRSVIELAGVQGLSYAEVGAVLGLPVKTVETRLYRARRQLRERLAAE